MELSNDGATFFAEGFQLLQGPSEAPMTAAQCKFADLDLVVSFWLVRLQVLTSPSHTSTACHGTGCVCLACAISRVFEHMVAHCNAQISRDGMRIP